MDDEAAFFAPVSLVDRVAELLREDIVRGRIKPGEKITEVALARRLGISRNPIREAVRRLEGTGLLVNHPRRGRFVREIGREEADDIFFFRASIERSAIHRVACRRTSKDIAELRAILEAMHAAAKQGDTAETFAQDVRFHRAICEISGSRRATYTSAVRGPNVAISWDIVSGSPPPPTAAAGAAFPRVADGTGNPQCLVDVGAGDRIEWTIDNSGTRCTFVRLDPV